MTPPSAADGPGRAFSTLPGFLCLFFLILDQVTKHLTIRFVDMSTSIPVIPGFFNIVHVHNPGAAFGMFHGLSMPLYVVSIVIFILLLIYRNRLFLPVLSHRIAFGLMLGGILGNMIDRIKYSYVIDFLDFYITSHHWPAFNVADSCICVGTALYLISSFRTPNPAASETGGVKGDA